MCLSVSSCLLVLVLCLASLCPPASLFVVCPSVCLSASPLSVYQISVLLSAYVPWQRDAARNCACHTSCFVSCLSLFLFFSFSLYSCLFPLLCVCLSYACASAHNMVWLSSRVCQYFCLCLKICPSGVHLGSSLRIFPFFHSISVPAHAEVPLLRLTCRSNIRVVLDA